MSHIKRNKGLMQYRYSVVDNRGHRVDNMNFYVQALWLKFKIDTLHNKLGWGYPSKQVGGDGFQPTYSCKYCKSELAQDSSGAYFHLGGV